jgi:predicted ester cyclase
VAMTAGRIADVLVRDVWNDGHPDTAFEIIHPDLPGMNGTGAEATLAWHLDRRAAFSDLRYRILTMVESGRSAAFRWLAKGTHTGDFGPISATGLNVDYQGATFICVETGLITELWSVNDLFGLVQSLGATLVPPGSGSTASTQEPVQQGLDRNAVHQR